MYHELLVFFETIAQTNFRTPVTGWHVKYVVLIPALIALGLFGALLWWLP
ncbi:MAG: hypothetical protein JWN86_3910 [Planctomycetota bacterium]|nr:hypothetical protein [Planctomycetota bacterium]